MAKKLQILRGTTAQNDAYTGSIGELTMDTEKVEVRIHDGTTQGGKTIGSGGGASLPILMAVWSDHVINDISWLRADTFSWQSGDVYVAAYEHLVDDLDVVPAIVVTDGSTYPVYVRYVDGDVSDARNPYCWRHSEMGYVYTSEESPSVNDYVYSTATGAGSSGYIYSKSTRPSMFAQTDTIGDVEITYYQSEDGHKICLPDQESNIVALYEATGAAWYYILNTANKQFKLPREDKDGKYLYFYVGNFEKEAIEQTAGITAETLNGKADSDLGNIPTNYDYVVESQMPSAENNYTWYRKYKSGWVEQGGFNQITMSVNGADNVITLPVVMSTSDYIIDVTLAGTYGGRTLSAQKSKATTTTITVGGYVSSGTESNSCYWQVSGHVA